MDCGKRGHIARDCPDATDDEKETTNTQTGTNASPNRESDAAQLPSGAVKDGEFDWKAVQFCCIDDELTLNVNGHLIPLKWLLLDNQSTVDVISNPKLLRNTQKVSGSLRINTQADSATTSWHGLFPGCGWVWHHPNGMANILLLARVKDDFRVTFDSANGNEFHMFKADETQRTFRQSKRGLLM